MVCGQFIYLVTDISATVAPIGMTFCMMVHISPGQKVSPVGQYPQRNPKIQHFGPPKTRYLQNSKSQHYTLITA